MTPVPGNPFARWSLDDLRGRRSAKWAMVAPDVLALWVAEMDTAPADAVVAAVQRLLASGDTGYPTSAVEYAEAFAGFAQARWGWSVDVGAVRGVNDVLTGVGEVLRQLTDPGGAVVITPPVYPPFRMYVEHLGRTVVNAELRADGRLDLATLEEAFDKSSWRGSRPALLLASPHNPTGVVHTADELAQVAALAARYGVRVVVDEIHAALTYPGVRFVPYLSVPGSDTAVVVTSGAKAWNLAGIKAALIIPGAQAATALAAMSIVVDHSVAAVGLTAHAAAFRDGVGWLDEHLAGLTENREQLSRLVAGLLPAARYRPPEGTYLAWLDLRGYGLDGDPAELLLDRARVRLGPGPEFGPGGDGFVRLNFATAPSVLDQAVRRMAAALPAGP